MVADMSWSWTLEAADGAELTKPVSPSHSNQSDAESWLVLIAAT